MHNLLCLTTDSLFLNSIFQANEDSASSYGKLLQIVSIVYQLLQLLMKRFSAVMEVHTNIIHFLLWFVENNKLKTKSFLIYLCVKNN